VLAAGVVLFAAVFPDVPAVAPVVVAAEGLAGIETNPGNVAVDASVDAAGLAAAVVCPGALSGFFTVTRN
jgi:hypothetical protein